MSVIVTPLTSTIYSVPVPGKMQAVVVKQNQQATVQVQIVDGNGDPIDLTTLGFPSMGTDPNYTISVQIQEAIGASPGVSAVGTVIAPTTGTIQFTPPSTIIGAPGIYIAECGALNAGNLLVSTTYYLWIDRGLFVVNNAPCRPSYIPTLQELRLSIRDQPELNLLTNTFEHDVADCADAIVRTVLYFNSAPPTVINVSTLTMFDRYFWLEGTIVHLLESVGVWFRRNNLEYTGGGLAVNDLNRADAYDAAVAKRREQWVERVRMAKAHANLEMGWGMVESDYSIIW